ncbi:MAG: type II toxin-antitoxin system death-on-curing family toxin [Promethearchaeota archaeon]
MWFPSIDFILMVYRERIPSISKPLINVQDLKGILDKMKFGIPYHETPTIWDRATIFFREIVENHYFIDGNKRIGILVAIIFLNLNGYKFSPAKGEIFSFTMRVAEGKSNYKEIKIWFGENSVRL